MQIVDVTPSKWIPVDVVLVELVQQIPADIRLPLAETVVPPFALLPVALDPLPEPDRRRTKARMRLHVAIVFQLLHGRELVVPKLVPHKRREVANRKRVAVQEDQDIARALGPRSDYVGKDVQLDRMRFNGLGTNVVE
jgi:hypothetical protein